MAIINGTQPGQALFYYYGNVLGLQQSGPTTDGYLSAVDWNRFNFQSAGVTPPFTFAGSWRVKADGTFQLWNPDQSLWHTIQVHGLAGAEYMTIGVGEAT